MSFVNVIWPHMDKSYHHLPPLIYVEMDQASISPSPPPICYLTSSPPLLGNAHNKFFLSVSLSLLYYAEQRLLPASFSWFYSSRVTHTCQLNFNHFSTHQRQ